MERVVVLGSNSFSGSDFVDLLLERGGYEVHGVSRSPEKSALFLPYLARAGPRSRSTGSTSTATCPPCARSSTSCSRPSS